MEYSVVIPVFNEEECLRPLQEELYGVMEKVTSDYEIIYIDDGSKDSSLAVLKELKNIYPRIKIISFMFHTGQSVALIAGFKVSVGRWIITLDSDLQNPPIEILKLLRFKDSFDFIIGVRKKRRDGFIKVISAKVAAFSRLLVVGDATKDTGCALKVFKREIVGALHLFRNFHRFFAYLAREEGFSVKEVDINHRPRRFGRTKYGTLKRIREGLFDLVGIFWLKKRSVRYKIKHEY